MGLFFFWVGLVLYPAQPTLAQPTGQENSRLRISPEQWAKEGKIPLHNQWEFYWGKLIPPQRIQWPEPTQITQFPHQWNDILDLSVFTSAHGFATYRLRLTLPEPGEYAIRLDILLTSYALYADGRLIAGNGKVGTDRKSTSPSYRPLIALFDSDDREVDLVLHLANFHHKRGGPATEITLGKPQGLMEDHILGIGYDLFLFGSLSIMCLYHIGLYLFRRQEPSSLYFSVLSGLVAIRALFFGERFINQFDLPLNWEWINKIEYWTFYVTVWALVMFFHSLFPREIPLWLKRYYAPLTLLLSLLVLLTPARVYSYSTTFMQVTVLMFGVICFHSLWKAHQNKREGVGYVIMGFLLLFATIINDVLTNHQIIHTHEMVPIGFFLMLLFQALVLAKRFAAAHATAEHLSLTLEDQVTQRTLELNQTLQEFRQLNRKNFDSIQYASLIQQSILPPRTIMEEAMPDSFLIWQPREQISGDVYFIHQSEQGLLVLLADCTGHGVPGALMTMVTIASLRQILMAHKGLNPAELLTRLNKMVQLTLRQDQQGSFTNDGLDAAACLIAPDHKSLQYAGARLPLAIFRKDEVELIKGTSQSLGYREIPLDVEFYLHHIEVVRGTQFLLFTDGITDQIGGEKNLPYGKKRLLRFFQKVQQLPMAEQRLALMREMEVFRDIGQQRDDITLLSFRCTG